MLGPGSDEEVLEYDDSDEQVWLLHTEQQVWPNPGCLCGRDVILHRDIPWSGEPSNECVQNDDRATASKPVKWRDGEFDGIPFVGLEDPDPKWESDQYSAQRQQFSRTPFIMLQYCIIL